MKYGNVNDHRGLHAHVPRASILLLASVSGHESESGYDLPVIHRKNQLSVEFIFNVKKQT